MIYDDNVIVRAAYYGSMQSLCIHKALTAAMYTLYQKYMIMDCIVETSQYKLRSSD
jgi:hypothetical protein